MSMFWGRYWFKFQIVGTTCYIIAATVFALGSCAIHDHIRESMCRAQLKKISN
jgi:hypothetical protein